MKCPLCHHEGCSLACKRDTMLLVARILFAAILITHGWGKLMGPMPGMAGFTGMLAGLSFPIPAVWAWVVALIETLGGLAILLGVWAEKAAMLVAIEFLVIVLYVKKMNWSKAELDMAMLALSLVFSAFGAGKYAIMKPAATAVAESKK